MSLTLLTAAYLEAAVYGELDQLPEGIVLGERYDFSTVQAQLYHDERRGVTGCGVCGSNERWDWLRNVDIRQVDVDGYLAARGWFTGAKPLVDWCAKRGVSEIQGHSKGAAEAQIVAHRLRNMTGRRIHCLALETPKPWRGTPPPLPCLSLRNRDDFVAWLPGPGWKSAGIEVALAWEPPDWQEDHTMARVIAALLRNEQSVWSWALSDDDSGPVTKQSRALDMPRPAGFGAAVAAMPESQTATVTTSEKVA